MISKHFINELKSATDKYLLDLKSARYIHQMSLAVAEKLLAYSNNFGIAYSDVIDKDTGLTCCKNAFQYLEAYQFVVVTSRPCGLYPTLFTVFTTDMNGYDKPDFRFSSDDVDEVVNAIINYAEGKNG